MSLRLYNWLTYLSAGAAFLIAALIWHQGGRVMDVGNAVQTNKQAIIETKAEAESARKVAVDVKNRLDKLGLDIQDYVKVDKSTLAVVTRGRQERLAAQEMYLEELIKMKLINTELQKKVTFLEEQFKFVTKDHAQRLKNAEILTEEVKKLHKELEDCIHQGR